MKNNIILFLSAGIFSSCNLLDTGNAVESQNLLFEVEYINYAWGFAYTGVYINKYGEVYRYNIRQDSLPPISKSGYYSEEELNNKYSHNRRLIKNIDYSEVTHYKSFIPATADAPYSDTLQVGADMGAITYKCYQFDWKVKKYKEVVLLLEGDYTFKNVSSASDSLTNWLKKAFVFPYD